MATTIYSSQLDTSVAPLADGLTARLSVDALHRDDWQYSFTRKRHYRTEELFRGPIAARLGMR